MRLNAARVVFLSEVLCIVTNCLLHPMSRNSDLVELIYSHATLCRWCDKSRTKR